MTRNSTAIPAIQETPVTPLYPDASQEPIASPTNRVALIEPGVGSFRVVYRDEHGYPMLDCTCDYRLTEEWRRALLSLLQRAGDDLPPAARRTAPLPAPSLLR